MGNRIIIYLDTSSDNDVFVIQKISELQNSADLKALSYEHPFFSEEERAIFKAALLRMKDKGYVEEEYIEKYLAADFNKYARAMIEQINILVEKTNNEQILETKSDYYICRFLFNKPAKIEDVSRLTTIHIIEKAILSHKYISIYEMQNKELDSQEIIEIIHRYKQNNDDSYAVIMCPFCQKNTIIVLQNGRHIGKCQVCTHEINIENNLTLYQGRDYAKASLIVNEKNSVNLENSVSTGIFRYHGTPYSIKRADEFFAIIYRNKDSKAFFKIVENRVVFKEEFLQYLEALDSKAAREIVTKLANQQVDEAMLFDENVALFWFYRAYKYAKRATKEEERKAIFTRFGTFTSPKDFVNKFLKSSYPEQKQLLLLLNETYIKYFFDIEGKYFFDKTPNGRFLSFSKLVYELAKTYVYISLNGKKDERILILKPSFLKSLLINDKQSLDRATMIEKVIAKDIPHFLGSTYNFSINYQSKRSDGYDLNCYFAMVYYRTPYYQYLNLRIPLNTKEAQDTLNDLVSNAYLHNKKEDFELLTEVYQNHYLDAIDLSALNALLDKYLPTYLNNKDIFELYLLINKSRGVAFNDLLIIYDEVTDTIYEHAKRKLAQGKYNEFAKNKTINHIADVLISNKNEVIDKAQRSFDSLNNEINDLIGGY